MHNDATHKLDVKMPLSKRALACLAHERKGGHHKLIQRGALGQFLLEERHPFQEFARRQRRKFRFHSVYFSHNRRK